MRKKEKNKENYINSLIEEEQIRLEVTQQALEVRLQVLQQALQEIQKEGINPVYVIIGCLQEYSGGYSLDDRTVDIFFVNESENAQLFKSLCDYYLTTINEKSDVELIQAENGNYYVNSEKICAALKSYFTDRDPDWGGNKCFKLPENDDLFKTHQQLYPDDNEFPYLVYSRNQVSFLIGVIMRNKTENKPDIVFANSPHKARMTIEFLLHILRVGESVFGEKLTVDYFFATPFVTRISYPYECLLWKFSYDFIEKLRIKSGIVL